MADRHRLGAHRRGGPLGHRTVVEAGGRHVAPVEGARLLLQHRRQRAPRRLGQGPVEQIALSGRAGVLHLAVPAGGPVRVTPLRDEARDHAIAHQPRQVEQPRLVLGPAPRDAADLARCGTLALGLRLGSFFVRDHVCPAPPVPSPSPSRCCIRVPPTAEWPPGQP